MSNYIDFTIGFDLVELEELFAANKAELKNMLQSSTHDGSSYTRRQMDDVRKNMAGIQQALQKLDPET